MARGPRFAGTWHSLRWHLALASLAPGTRFAGTWPSLRWHMARGVYPNPAGSMITIVINAGNPAGSAQRTGAGEASVGITDNIGSVLMRRPCRSIDVAHVDVSAWPVGAYQAAVVNAAGIVCTQRFSVVR